MNGIIHDHQGAVPAFISGAAAIIGTALVAAGPYLQPLAYIVSIVAGILAIIRATRK